MQNGQFSQPGKIYILLLNVVMFHSFDIYKVYYFILILGLLTDLNKTAISIFTYFSDQCCIWNDVCSKILIFSSKFLGEISRRIRKDERSQNRSGWRPWNGTVEEKHANPVECHLPWRSWTKGDYGEDATGFRPGEPNRNRPTTVDWTATERLHWDFAF